MVCQDCTERHCSFLSYTLNTTSCIADFSENNLVSLQGYVVVQDLLPGWYGVASCKSGILKIMDNGWGLDNDTTPSRLLCWALDNRQ